MPWPMYRRVERRAVRIHEMMRRLDVDPAKLARFSAAAERTARRYHLPAAVARWDSVLAS